MESIKYVSYFMSPWLLYCYWNERFIKRMKLKEFILTVEGNPPHIILSFQDKTPAFQDKTPIVELYGPYEKLCKHIEENPERTYESFIDIFEKMKKTIS